MPQNKLNLWPLLVCLLAGCVILLAIFLDKTNTVAIHNDQRSVQKNLAILQSSHKAAEKFAAVKFFAERPAILASTDWQKLTFILESDPDPKLRAAVAKSIGESRAKTQNSKLSQDLKEPQVLELLAAAYNSEQDPVVRGEIVAACGEFNHPDSLIIIDSALQDSDPNVREQAQQAKLIRENRLLSARLE